MPNYSCNLCNFYSNLKSNHKRHLLTSKHIKNENKIALKSQKEPEKSKKEPEKSQKEPEKSQQVLEFKCDYCEEKFKTFANKRRHELHRCKENTSLNHITDSSIKTTIKVINIKHEKEKKQLYKQIEKLIDKAGNTTHIQNTQNTQNTQNIKLNSYGKEDLSHITDMFKTKLLKMPHGMIPKMIEAVHFNDNKPENKNMQFTNKRDNKIKVFSNDKWVHKSKDETIHDLMDGKYFILDTHYSKVIEHNNPDGTNSTKLNILDFYEKFRQLFDERDNKLIEDQRKECELVLLNNR